MHPYKPAVGQVFSKWEILWCIFFGIFTDFCPSNASFSPLYFYLIGSCALLVISLNHLLGRNHNM